MAKGIPADDCNCDHLCPDCSGCIAMFVHDKSECWLLCPCEDVVDIPDAVTLALDAPLNIVTREVELAKLAELLDSLCELQLLIPAAAASKAVTLDQKYTTLGALIQHLGLVTQDAQPSEQGE